jgi:hypothetical protein
LADVISILGEPEATDELEKDKPEAVLVSKRILMGHAYDFDAFLLQHPREKGNQKQLVPERAAKNLLDLRCMLEDSGSSNYVPQKSDKQLLLATWNVQNFGGTDRYDESLWYIAEILSHFDLIAIQEVTRSLQALQSVVGLMGPWWKFIVSDVKAGRSGNEERIAYLYDNRKVRLAGKASYIALPQFKNKYRSLSPEGQLEDTPFMAAFKAGWFQFVLSTFHVVYGGQKNAETASTQEVKQIVDFMLKKSPKQSALPENLILLGDFNMFDPDGIVAQVLVNCGFSIPHGRESVRSTNVGLESRFYDQIAILLERNKQLNHTPSGVMDFFDAVYSDEKFEEYREELRLSSGAVPSNPLRYYRSFWRRREMSDHMLLWVQLSVDFSYEYLAGLVDA